MRLYLIRHGQSTNNALYEGGASEGVNEYETERSHDPQLTEIGQQQAEHVAQFLAGAVDMPLPELEPLKFDHLYVSPMIRALDTAKPIAEALNIAPEVWVDIHEIGGLFLTDKDDQVTGFPGLGRQEMAELYPDFCLPDAIREDGWWDMAHGRETPAGFLSRTIKVALALRERAHSDERIALVAHAGFLDSLIKALLNQLPNHPANLFYNHYNTGITRIDFGESHFEMFRNHMRFHYMNRVDHLSPELRTW